MDLYIEIKKSFPIIEKLFTEESLLKFKTTSVSELHDYHFGLGTWIRNNMLRPEKGVLYNLFLDYGIEHPDDMSSLIIKLFHDYIRYPTS